MKRIADGEGFIELREDGTEIFSFDSSDISDFIVRFMEGFLPHYLGREYREEDYKITATPDPDGNGKYRAVISRVEKAICAPGTSTEEAHGTSAISAGQEIVV